MADNTEAFLFRDIAMASIAHAMEKLDIKVSIPPIDTMAVAKELGIEDQVSEEQGTRNSLDSAIRLQLIKDFEDAVTNAFASSAVGATPNISHAKSVLDKAIDECEFSRRVKKVLMRLNIETLGQLIAFSESQLMHFNGKKVKNFGQHSIENIKSVLKSLGLELKKE